jgi:hypothetical protein
VGVEETRSGPAVVLHGGEVLVDSSETATAWYVGSPNVSALIDRTRATFSAGLEGDKLAITALSGHLSGRDDFGRPFDLREGEKLLATADSAATAPEPKAAHKTVALASAKPTLRTLFYAGFESAPKLESGVIERERGGNEFLVAANHRGLLSARIALPKPAAFENNLALRLRVRTNLPESRIVLTIEDKATLTYVHRTKREQRHQWVAVEFLLDAKDLKLEPIRPEHVMVTPRDRIMSIGVVGNAQDADDERGFLHIDDVRFGVSLKK